MVKTVDKEKMLFSLTTTKTKDESFSFLFEQMNKTSPVRLAETGQLGRS